MNTDTPVIISFDLEVAPGTYLCYGQIWELIHLRTLQHEQILSCAWQVYGENKVHYIAQNMLKGYIPGKLDDRNLLIEITKVLSKAEYLCGHNVDSYDMKMLQQRIMFHRLPPFPDIPTLDTKKLIKSAARLPSNKLQHVTEFLGNGGKLEHGGSDLFIGCMNGDPKAWNLNKRYNKQDVRITTKDLEDMLPYVKLNARQKVFVSSAEIQCHNPTCMSMDLIKSKRCRVAGGWKQQWQCRKCGSYTQDKKLQKD